jgi:hypothetical protein
VCSKKKRKEKERSSEEVRGEKVNEVGMKKASVENKEQEMRQ